MTTLVLHLQYITPAYITLAGKSEFIRNQCACQLLTSDDVMCELGCGVTAFNSNLTFTGNTSFHGNKQTASDRYYRYYCAGAIYASISSLHLIGTNNFIGNLAKYGGAVLAKTNTLVTFIGTSNFYHNSAYNGGAVYTNDNATLTFIGISSFNSNSADYNGGAIYAVTFTSGQAVLSFNGINNFINNCAQRNGGAIHAQFNASSKFIGNNMFRDNSAGYEGGAIYAHYNVTLMFNGINNFINNSLHNFLRNSRISNNGGAIYAITNVSLSFNGTSNFCHNSAEIGGVFYIGNKVVCALNGTKNFINNSAIKQGGMMYAEATSGNVVLSFTGTNNFINNLADSKGGVIHTKANAILEFNGTNNFTRNSAKFGGAIHTYNTVLIFNGTNNFNNSAKYFGGAMFVSHSIFIFSGSNNFTGNSANSGGGAISAVYNRSLSFTGTSSFCSNSAIKGGAIFASFKSTVTFNGSISFTDNGHSAGDTTKDSCGGAIYLGIISTLSFLPHTTVCWENNHANLGGAIYVMNSNPLIYCAKIAEFIPKQECFFQLPGQNIDVQLFFKNNSADVSGSVVYGGAIDNCKVIGLNSSTSGKVFDLLVQQKSKKIISSDPFHVYLCENNHPSKSRRELSIYPGETFYVSVVSTGQRNGIVPAQVTSHMDEGRLLNSQYIQKTTKTCTTLNYTVFSLQNVTIELYADGPCSTFGDKLVLKLNVNQTCPPGFSLANSSMSCVCDQALQKYTNRCNISNGIGQITRESDDTFWVGYDQYHGLNVYPHCPFDYCVSDKIVFPPNNADMQCANNRSGLLCGACSTKQCNDSIACNNTGYSVVLGSSHCKQCTNIYLLLLIPFAVMGVALVFLLFVCKLTVATGTLSGLVFYANIVGANHGIFLPAGSTDALSIFIAWLNLDFGIETCFYNGMDASSKACLQFVFPVYIWMLVGFMILLSHYSQRFAKLLGSNPVSVLATLVLLSYAKILRTCITAISPITLQYQYGRAWLYDANVAYFSGKHIPLSVLAIFFFFLLFLPYTLLLLFGQWLQAISHLRLFSWVNSARLKPFMDSYHAPYKAKHRYWPGLLLVLRSVLLVAFAQFASNPQQDPGINLLAILLGAGILHIWTWVSGGIYKNWCLDALEGSFVLNLIVLGVATYHVKLSGGNKFVAGYISVTIAFATFIGILAYHIIQQLISTKLWKKMPKLNFELRKLNIKLNKKLNTDQAEDNLNISTNNNIGSGRFDQLREPLLDDPPRPTHSVV